MTRINPALRVVQHGSTSLQIGLGSAGAVLNGLKPTDLAFLRALRHGVQDTELPLLAKENGVTPLRLELLLASVKDYLVHDSDFVTHGSRSERLLPEQLAILARYQQPSKIFFQRRDQAVVHLIGLGRVGSNVALLLANAGVGTLLLEDDSVVTGVDVGPAGFTTADIGLAHSSAVRRLALAANPTTRIHLIRQGGAGGPDASCVDLVIVVTHDAVAPALTARLMNVGRAQLFVLLRELDATLGPLVVPGQSACAECVELHRGDFDPHWLETCQQLTASDAPKNTQTTDNWNHTLKSVENPSEAMAVAGTAASQVLLFLDGINQPSVWSAVMTLHSDNGRWSRQEFSPHPHCGCQMQSQALATISSTASP